MNSLFKLTGKTALVTGSSQGLGLTMAQGLLDAGASVILNGRNAKKLTRAIDRLNANKSDIHSVVFDVREENQIQKAIQDVEHNIGPIDILVNNAGINIRHPLENFPVEDWETVIDINLKGAFLVSKIIAQGMIQRKSGKIINVCSMQSELGRTTITPYAASKGGLKMLTKSMATELAKYNIQVNGIGPGYFKTDMTRPLWEDKEFDQWLRNRTPANRWGNPEELIGPLVFLSSRASDYVNGHILYVDGGLLASI